MDTDVKFDLEKIMKAAAKIARQESDAAGQTGNSAVSVSQGASAGKGIVGASVPSGNNDTATSNPLSAIMSIISMI